MSGDQPSRCPKMKLKMLFMEFLLAALALSMTDAKPIDSTVTGEIHINSVQVQAFLDLSENRPWINARNVEQCMKWVDHNQPLMNYLQLLTGCVAAMSPTRYTSLALFPTNQGAPLTIVFKGRHRKRNPKRSLNLHQ